MKARIVLLACVVLPMGCRQLLDLEDKTDCETDADCFDVDCRKGVCKNNVCSPTGPLDFGAACGQNGLCNEGGACIGAEVILASNVRHTCALMRDQRLWCWGVNSDGQLGDGTQQDKFNPTPVSGLPLVSSASIGYAHTCAIDLEGAVWCWGNNQGLQVGKSGALFGPPVLTPFHVPGVPPATKVTAGRGHTCALTEQGEVFCWGDNENGQCGVEKQVVVAPPMKVAGLPPIGDTISTIKNHACAITRDGDLYCWGYNGDGELGNGTISSSPEPKPQLIKLPESGTVTNLGLSFASSCAITNSHTYCWGDNGLDQVGALDTSKPQLKPAIVSAAPMDTHAARSLVSTSASFGCYIKDNGGGYECWGTTWPGQLGAQLLANAADKIEHASPYAEEAMGIPTTVTATAFGDQHGCAIFPADSNDKLPTIRCFGHTPELGIGSSTEDYKTSPTPVVWSVPR